MIVAIDTNVLVSGMLREEGPPGRIVNLIYHYGVHVAVDHRVIGEYQTVTRRAKFALPDEKLQHLFDSLQNVEIYVDARDPAVNLPDPKDNMFLEVALAAGADFLITGNLRHFPARSRRGVRVVNPKQFIDGLRA